MKITVPEKEVGACDLCHREDACLQTCLSCGNRYCLLCEAIIYGSIHKVDVCRKCGQDKLVLEVVDKFAQHIKSVLQERNGALIKLNVRDAQ